MPRRTNARGIIRQENGDGSSRKDDRGRSRVVERRRAGYISCARRPLAIVGAHSRRPRRKSRQDNQVCGAGYLRSIASGARYSMFQELGSGSTACRIDPAGVLLASEAVRRGIEAGWGFFFVEKVAELETRRAGPMFPLSAGGGGPGAGG